MSLPFKRADAKEAARGFLRRRMEESTPSVHLAFAGDDAGTLFVEGREDFIYARVGSVTGEVIQARADLLVPDKDDLILISPDPTTKGMLRVVGIMSTQHPGGLNPFWRKFHKEFGHTHQRRSSDEYDAPPLDVVYSLSNGTQTVTGDVLILGSGVEVTISGNTILLQTESGHTISTSGSPLPQRRFLDFSGEGVEVFDDEANDRTRIVIQGSTGQNFVWNETPNGEIDGENTVFTLGHEPISGTLRLYLNGLRLREGEGNDYMLTGNTIVMANAPISGDWLMADYLFSVV